MKSSSEIMNSGEKANKTGVNLESFVEDLLKRQGYVEFWNHKKQMLEIRDTIVDKQYGKQIEVGETIYGTRRFCDFLVINKDKFPNGLIIECKWQEVSGSVDEKFPYLWLNILKSNIPTIVILDGKGCRERVRKWFKEKAGKDRALREVLTMAEFQKKVNNGFLG